MKIAIGSDHAGFQLKEIIKSTLTGLGHEIVDFGTTQNHQLIFLIMELLWQKAFPKVILTVESSFVAMVLV